MSINNVEICTKEKTFNRRSEWNFCADGMHKWEILVYKGDLRSMPGIAICTKCALLEGGWVRDNNG